MQKGLLLALILCLVGLGGCAGLNPNPGERTADTAWQRGDAERALEVARDAAQRGEPWAQLRMGIYSEIGFGVEPSAQRAADWYARAAKQYAEGKWAEGYLVGAAGKAGYFGQRNDAIIAEYRLADLYARGEGVARDRPRAYLLVNDAIAKMGDAEQVFFCCDWSGGRWFRLSQFTALRDRLTNEMSAAEMETVQARAASWDIKEDL